MQIIKTTMIIAILAVGAMIGFQQTASATSDDEDTTTVKVTLDGINSVIGKVEIEVSPQNGDSKIRTIDPLAKVLQAMSRYHHLNLILAN